MAEQVSKRSVVYEILVDFQQGKKTVQDAEKAIEEFSKEVNGAATGVEKFAKTTEASVGRLRQLKQQLNNFKGSQKDFEALSLEAARLQDQLDKTNRRIRTLASSTRQIEALASGVQGLVGVFTAVQGAAALFGQENKNLQQSILKVQGALALLQGVQAAVATITEQSAFKTIFLSNAQKAYNFVVGTSTGLLKAFRLALAATGVGLAIVGITELARVMGLFGDKTKESTDALNEYKKKLQETQKAIVENAKLTRAASDTSIDAIERQIEFAKANGATQTQIFTLEQYLREQQLKELKTQLEEQQKLRTSGVQVQYAVFVDLENKIKDKQNEILVAQRKFSAEQLKIFEEQQKERQRIADQRRGSTTPLEIQGAEGITSQSAFQAEQERIAREKAENEKQGLIVKTAEVQQTAHEMLKQQMEAEIAMYEARNQVLLAAGSIFGSLLQLQVGGSKAQLALAIAEILTNQAVAISKAISSAKGVTAFDYAAQVATAVATAIGTFAQINAVISQAKAAQSAAASQAATQAEGFAEGTPYLDDASAPHGRDTIPIWADRGEAIIPTRKNMEEPGLAAAWINGNLDDYINVNYVAPALAAKTIEEIKHDSTIDYSTRFYKQLLVTAEGNAINKKALSYLSSINDRLNRTIPSRYA